MEEIEIVAFDKSDEAFMDYGERGIRFAIDAGRMTEEDGQLIRAFVRQLKSERNIGTRRAYKITNALSNTTRFFKTPLKENTIFDLYEGFEKLKKGKKIKRVSGGIIETDEPMTQNAVRDYMMFMKRLYQWMIDEGLCEIPRQKVDKIQVVSQNYVTKTADDLLTEEQIYDMLNSCRSSRDRAIIATLYEGAFRIGEIADMRWQDVDFLDKHFCTVTTDFKTGNDRHIPLHMAREYLLQWMNDYPGEARGRNPVFVSKYKTSLTYTSIKFQLNAIADRAGIGKHITPHIFRHSRITHMIKDGWTDSTVKSIAWGNLETGMFKTYVHLTKKDIINEARKHNGIEVPEGEAGSNALKHRQCPRCLMINSPTNNFCSVCGAPLTEAVVLALKEMKEEIASDPVYAKVMDDLEKKIGVLHSLSQTS